MNEVKNGLQRERQGRWDPADMEAALLSCPSGRVSARRQLAVAGTTLIPGTGLLKSSYKSQVGYNHGVMADDKRGLCRGTSQVTSVICKSTGATN